MDAVPRYQDIQTQALSLHLHENPQWLALIHQTRGVLSITDPAFILSGTSFSASHELLKTVEALFSGPDADAMRCRFPARYRWLTQHLGLEEQPMPTCLALTEYLQKVPADTVQLVFASENLAQPSSMMGHVFLKLSGKNLSGERREHAVTFYTDANSINLPKIILQNLTSGMPGFFGMLPYVEALHQYYSVENRKVWEYEVLGDRADNELLRLHLFELRSVDIHYFFHRYNCATLVDELITIHTKVPPSIPSLWTTPKDVVKRLSTMGRAGVADVIVPAESMLRTLEERFSGKQLTTLRKDTTQNLLIDTTLFDSDEAYVLAWEFLHAENDYSFAKGHKDKQAWRVRKEELARIQPHKDYQLEVPQTGSPVAAIGDSQVSVGLIHRDGSHYFGASYLPASHDVLDDVDAALAGSELKLFYTKLLGDVVTGQVFLDQFVMYSSQIRPLWSRSFGGISRGFRMAYEPQRSSTLEYQHHWNVLASVGLTLGLGRAARLMFDLEGGIGVQAHGAYVIATPKAGLLIDATRNIKTLISAQTSVNPFGQQGRASKVDVLQRLAIDRQQGIEFGVGVASGSATAETATSAYVNWKYIF